EQLLHGRPVSRRRGDAQVASGERGPELRARDALRVPGVDLARAEDELLRLPERLLQFRLDACRQRPREEADLVALGILRDLAERIPLDDARELGGRADDDVDREPELVLDHALALARGLLRLRPALQDDVSALEVGPYLGEAGLFERLAKPGHGHPISRPEIDSAQEDDLRAHAQPPRLPVGFRTV